MPGVKNRLQPEASAELMVEAVSPALTTKNWLIGSDVPGVLPLAQLGPEALVRSDGRNTRYLPVPSMNRYGTSRETGVVPSVVSGGFGNVFDGAPPVPENTMFQTPPVQLPKLESRVYHCCCETDEVWPETLVSAM
jgi:hypothetical protein